MAKAVDELRDILDAATLEHEGNYSPYEKDVALQTALHELVRDTPVNRQTATGAALTADTPTLDLTGVSGLELFRPERLVKAWITAVNRSTWTTATAYEEGDVVTGDGSPDAYLYQATQDHTSSASDEPPNTSYWKRVMRIPRTAIEKYDLDTVEKELDESTEAAEPTKFAFETATKLIFNRAPDKAYPFPFLWWKPLAMWDAGTKQAAQTTISLPDDILVPTVVDGAASYLLFSDPAARETSDRYKRFRALLTRLQGSFGRGPRVIKSKQSARLTVHGYDRRGYQISPASS